jgi:hypothetical protein
MGGKLSNRDLMQDGTKREYCSCPRNHQLRDVTEIPCGRAALSDLVVLIAIVRGARRPRPSDLTPHIVSIACSPERRT